jgi:hypothetical protein
MSFHPAAALPLMLLACSSCQCSERDRAQASSSIALSGGSVAIAASGPAMTGGGGSTANATNSEVGSGASRKTAGAAGAPQDTTATARAAPDTPTRIKATNGAGELIRDCQPCDVTISESLPSYSIRFESSATDQGRAVRALHLLRADRPGWSQSLTVHDMEPIASHEKFIFGATDINFDGRADLLFSTRRGASNVYADYWVFVPSSGEFEYLGNYPTFRIDRTSQTLSTYESGGAAGLIYESNQYKFIGGKITVTQREKQDETDEFGVFVKAIYRLSNGTLREVSRQRVEAPKPKE